MPKKILGGIGGKALVLAALVCLGALVAGSTGAVAKKGPTTTTIKIKQKPNGEPYFDVPGDGTVLPGSDLAVKNKTSPKKIGPHTFSLVTSPSIPKTKPELKDCGKLKDGTICQAIANWHEVTFSSSGFHVGQKLVEAGLPGWDTEGDPGPSDTGDSQFFLKKGQSFSRQVSAAPGTTIHFVCAVHPEMHGHFTVAP